MRAGTARGSDVVATDVRIRIRYILIVMWFRCHAWLSGSRLSALNSYALHFHYPPAGQILALSTVIFHARRPGSTPGAGRSRNSGRVRTARGRERLLDAHALGIGIFDAVLPARRLAPQSNAPAARMVRRGGRGALDPGIAATPGLAEVPSPTNDDWPAVEGAPSVRGATPLSNSRTASSPRQRVTLEIKSNLPSAPAATLFPRVDLLSAAT
jgi:hypothetical protein